MLNTNREISKTVPQGPASPVSSSKSVPQLNAFGECSITCFPPGELQDTSARLKKSPTINKSV